MAADQIPIEGGEGAKPSGKNDAAPEPAVRRLSLYLRELERFLRDERQTVSSKQLGETLGLTDAQVRKDLAYFGQFGHPGIGYRVGELIARIRCILGTDRTWNVLLVGAGYLGKALLSYRGFARKGFRIVAVLDNDPSKIGRPIGVDGELEVLPFEKVAEVVAERDIQIGMISVPAEVAQDVANTLLAVGVKSLLNFAPVALTVPAGVPLGSVDLAVHLEQLAFRIVANQIAAEK